MVKYETEHRVECMNLVRPGKICGAHLPEGRTFCPVCGEKTITRPVDQVHEVGRERPGRKTWFRVRP